jgi:hypothetical protein
MENLRKSIGLTGQQDDNARYCILKVLMTRGQHRELGKNVPLGQAEPLRWTPPQGAGIDIRRTGPRIESVLSLEESPGN